MAAPQPSAKGFQSSNYATKSFAQLFSQPANSPIQLKQTTTYKGEAAVIFSKSEADKLAAPFRWALIGKFSHGRPSLEQIRKFFSSLNLRNQISVGLMDYQHVLLKCTNEADFNRIWTRGLWQMGKHPLRVFRWTRDFHVQKESSLVPVWTSLPALPIHYHDKHSLFSILSPVGKPLFLDSATAAGTRPSVARVCLEVDLLKPICPRVWVAVEGEMGFWQKIVIENLPNYCNSCWRLGHTVGDCKKASGMDVLNKGKQPRRYDQSEQPLVGSIMGDKGNHEQHTGATGSISPEAVAAFADEGHEQELPAQENKSATEMRNRMEEVQVEEDTDRLADSNEAPQPTGGLIDVGSDGKSAQVTKGGRLVVVLTATANSQEDPKATDNDEDSKSNAADEVALPTNVGNLSPRLVIPREKSAEPSIQTLNIDQSVGVQMDCRQDRVKGVRAGFPSDRQLRSATSSQNSFQIFSHD